MNGDATEIVKHFQKWGGVAGNVGTLGLAVVLWISHFSADKAHTADVATQQSQDIQVLAGQVKALQAEVSQTKEVVAPSSSSKNCNSISRLQFDQ